MFGLGPATKIYIAVEGVDMRKGFDGLYGLVRDRLGLANSGIGARYRSSEDRSPGRDGTSPQELHCITGLEDAQVAWLLMRGALCRAIPKPLEGSGVGWQRAVGVREAAGEGPFPLAYRAGRELRDVAAGRIGDAGKRVGPDASAAAQDLVAAGTCCIKHFFVFTFEITGNKLSSDLQSNLLA